MKNNNENKPEAEWFLNKKPSARELFNEDLGYKWHPTVGGRLVGLKDVSYWYDKREQAVDAARGFKNHCARIMNLPDIYKLNDLGL